MELIDIGRCKIDTALKQRDKQTALLTAQRLFPRQQRILEGAMVRGDEVAFRELCGIQGECELVDDCFLPGSYAKHGATITMPEPKQVPVYQINYTEIAKPVIFIGGLCIVVALVVTLCKAILTGMAVAFVVIGEYMGYIAAAFVALVALRLLFMRSGANAEQYNKSGGEGIFVNVNINGQNHIQQ